MVELPTFVLVFTSDEWQKQQESEKKKRKKTEHQEIVSFYFVESFNEMVHLICLQK